MRAMVFGSGVAVLLSITSAAHAQPATEDIKSKAQRLVAPLIETRDSRLRPVATFDHQVTGVTVAPDGRIFANSPRWTEERFPWPNSCRTVRLSRTLMKNGTPGAMSEISPNDHFVCVQNVVADRRGSL
jgi:hypothetical protein